MNIDIDNYFDIAEALYCYVSLHHEGQFSDKYAALCNIPFLPGPYWRKERVEKDNEYYHYITEDNWEALYKELMTYLGTI